MAFEREGDGLAGGIHPRAKISQVVQVGAVRDVPVSLAPGQFRQVRIKLGLAVKAAIGLILSVLRLVLFAGGKNPMPVRQADGVQHLAAGLLFAGRQ